MQYSAYRILLLQLLPLACMLIIKFIETGLLNTYNMKYVLCFAIFVWHYSIIEHLIFTNNEYIFLRKSIWQYAYLFVLLADPDAIE